MIGLIGAGVSGLSLAFFLQKNKLPYILLEASDRTGGYIRTIREQDYLLELGPNSLLIDAEMESFIEEIGLREEILPANEISKNRYIYRRGRYRKLPSKPQELIFNNFFSLKSKVAIYNELKKPARFIPHETLSSFFERRFSKEIVDYALNPFVSGIYAGNPEELLVEKTFPIFLDYEKKYGSVIRGLVKNKNTGRKKTISFKEGMETLPKMLAGQLQNLVLLCQVQDVKKEKDKFILQTLKDDILVDIVVICSPAYNTYPYLANLNPTFAENLKKVNYPPLSVVHTVYPKNSVRHPLNGFGGLNPKIENLFTAGSIWTSSVFPNRCPKNQVLFTSFVGGSQSVEHTKLPDEKILKNVHQELAKNFRIREKPLFQKLFRWERAIPQYDKHILAIHKDLTALEKENIFVCANWKDGVSVVDCVKKAKNLAEHLAILSKNK